MICKNHHKYFHQWRVYVTNSEVCTVVAKSVRTLQYVLIR